MGKSYSHKFAKLLQTRDAKVPSFSGRSLYTDGVTGKSARLGICPDLCLIEGEQGRGTERLNLGPVPRN